MESSALKSRPLEIRVATGTSDRQLSSAIWRIWQGKNNHDIYIAVRQIAGTVKCSVHSNHYCYVGFTKQFAYVAVFARPEDFDYSGFVEKRLPEIRANFSRNPRFLVDEKVVLEAQALRMFLVNDPTIDGRLMVLDAAVQWAPTDEAVSS